MVKIQYVLLLTLGLAAGENVTCNNPLISIWDAEVQDYSNFYLQTSIDKSEVNLKYCSKALEDTDQSCCDDDTISKIGLIFQGRKDKMKQKTEAKQGAKNDTIKDLDPDVQEEKKGKGQGTGTEGKAKPVPGKPEPSDSEKEELRKEEGDKEWTQGAKGEQKERPGFELLSDEDKATVKDLVEQVIEFQKDKIKQAVKCMQAYTKFTVGMLCLACNPSTDFVSQTSGTTTVSISSDSCDKLEEKCETYVEQSAETYAKLKELEDAIKAIFDKYGDGTAEDNDIDDVTTDTKQPAIKCGSSGTDCKEYICVTMASEDGFGPNPATIEEPAEGTTRRRLQSSVTYSITDDGYGAYEVGDNSEVDASIEVEGITYDDDDDFSNVLGGLLVLFGLLIQ